MIQGLLETLRSYAHCLTIESLFLARQSNADRYRLSIVVEEMERIGTKRILHNAILQRHIVT